MKEPSPNVRAMELITGAQRALFGYIFSLVGSRDAADEILQNTNLVLCEKVSEYDGRAKFTTWACRIAYFEVLASRRRFAREKLIFMEDTVLDSVAELATSVAAESHEMLPRLRECVQELSPSSRSMIESRYQAGGSVHKLSRETGRSPGALRVALHRVRKHLLDCIQGKIEAAS